MPKKTPSVALSTFMREHYAASPQKLPIELLLKRVKASLHKAAPGYRSGVVLVPISPKGLISTVVTVQPDDKFVTTFQPRMDGEAPRKEIRVLRASLPPAVRADVVLYHHDVLTETKEASTEADWEVITLLAHSGTIPLPMHPDTLCYNHYRMSGGTATGFNAEKFMDQLKTSFTFWADKALATTS